MTMEKIINKLKEKFAGSILDVTEFRGETTVKVKPEIIVEFSSFLKYDSELKFELLEDLTAIDWAERKNRFSVIYHIFSIPNSLRIRIEVPLGTADNLDSVSGIWKTANWHERETYDMYGITFNNHPDLRRMYMPEEFEYHPLRKDFPLMGIPGSLPLPKK
ncbi:MAG: NADH-quinone oxidoreductase subunit C [Ignavibacteriaceae bacterium]|nr:NADH-quinone oxidoreductase subunit C [Ignavibacteriaceae bacterium]